MMRAIPPLLPWQPCLLAAVTGILAVLHPLPGLAAFALLAVFPPPATNRPSRLVLATACLLGFGLGTLALPAPPQDVPEPIKTASKVRLAGEVVSVTPKPENRLSVLLATVTFTTSGSAVTSLPGRLALTIDRPAFRPVAGDLVSVTSRIRTTNGFSNPGTADFAVARRLEDVFFRAYARGDKDQVNRISSSGNILAQWREALRQRVAAALAPPETADAAAKAGRAMVPALLFGDRSGLTEADLERVRRASLSHTLAISGMHVGFVAACGIALALGIGRLFPGLYLRLPRPMLAVLLAAPLVATYCWLGGASPSLVRATLMFAAFGLMLLWRRDKALLDGLFLALAAIILVSPLAVFDVRLQLSALAVAGIGVFWSLAPRLPPWLRLPGLRWALAIVWTSLCAEAAVLPVISRVFGDLTPNPWINLLWLPVLGGVTMPLALAGLAATAVPGLEHLGGWLLTGSALPCEGLMRLLAQLDAWHMLVSFAVLRPLWPEILGCFGLLAALPVAASGRGRPTVAMLASLVLLVGPILWRGLDDTRQDVRLTVLDVGQGQAVVLRLPGGRRLLVDAGGLFGNFDVGRAVVGDYLAYGRPPRLEMAFASHPHRDHVKGFISLLRRFAVGAYYDNGGEPEGSLAPPIDTALAERRVPHTALTAGDHLDLGDGLVLWVLHPGPDDDLSGNNGSLVLRLTWHGQGLAVLPGDAERGVLTRLARTDTTLQAAVLVMPHHGSVTSLSKRFYTAVAPTVAIASAGDSGHYPSPKILELLGKRSCATYATNGNGAVTVRFDSPDATPVVTTTR